MSNAFPMGATVPGKDGALKWEQVPGLTKREYAAIAAMQGLLANGSIGPCTAATDAVEYSDALLAELAR